MNTIQLNGLNSEPSERVIVRAGYLLKRGEIHKAWKVRWFELEDDKLKYKKTPEQVKAIDHIPLDQVVVRRSTESVGKEYCFELVTRNRIYHLVAKSRTDMDDWMRSLSLYTQLHTENNKIVEAEEEISVATFRISELTEQMFLRGN